MPDKIVTTSRHGPPAVTTASASAAAQQRLRASCYRALHNVRCEWMDGAMVLRGRVSSFYFKQLAQEVVRQEDGVRGIVNELEVEDWTRSATNPQANGKNHDFSTEKQESTEATHGDSDIDCG